MWNKPDLENKIVFILTLTAAFVGGFSILLASSRYSCATTPDSASYVAAATSMGTEGKMLGYDGRPFASWPPLYPAILAFASQGSGLSALDVVRWVGVVLFGIGAWLFFNLASRCLASPIALGLAWIGWALGSSLYLMFAAALSEALFIVLVLAFLNGVVRDSRTGDALALLAALLACLTRYMGIVLPVVFVLWNVLQNTTVRNAMIRSAQAALSLLPLGWWILRNHLETGTVSGIREGASISWLSNLLSGWDVLTQFLLPAFLPVGVRGVLLGAGLVLLAFTLRSDGGKTHDAPVRVLLLYVVIYGFLLTVLACLTYVDAFDFRLMSPLYPAVILVAAWLIDRIAKSGYPWARPIAGVAAVTFLFLSAQRAWAWTASGRSYGLGMYTDRNWQESRVLEKTRSLPADAVLFSNAADALYLQTGRYACLLPSRASSHSLCSGNESCYVIWFQDFWRTYTVDLNLLALEWELIPEYKDEDGGIYRLQRRSD